MSIKKKVAQAEELCRQEFLKYLGGKYEKFLVPKDPLSPIDILAISGNQEHWFELKFSDKFYVDSFADEGAMIDVKKWNSLVSLASKNPYVYYMRMYKDGFAVWHINSLTDQDWTAGNFKRKRVTVSNSSATKSKCVLISFNSALYIHREPIKLANGKILERITSEELIKSLKQ